MFRELFNDDEDISTSQNLVKRRQHQNSFGEMFNANTKGIASITRASTTNNVEKFITSRSNRIQKQEQAATTSVLQSLKSFFKCTSPKKFNEKIELNYPLNLHLQMNQIFAMHDKLCEISERFNDLYSIGMF